MSVALREVGGEALAAIRSLLDGGQLLSSSAAEGVGAGVSAVSRHSELCVLGNDRVLRAVRLRDCKLQRREIVKEMRCPTPLPSDAVEMKFNPSSECLAVRSETELHLVLTPPDVLRTGFASDDYAFSCR
jgi:hypothetical protein